VIFNEDIQNTQEQCEKIIKYLSRQRGDVSMTNLHIDQCAPVCHGKRLQVESYGNWHTIYICMNRWSKNGVLSRVFAALQTEGMIQINVEVVYLDSTSVKVHPDGTRALKKGNQAIGRLRGGLTTKIHMVTASDRSAVSFSLSSGSRHNSPEGMKLLSLTSTCNHKQLLLRDHAYEGGNMRATAKKLGYHPVVPPKKTRCPLGV